MASAPASRIRPNGTSVPAAVHHGVAVGGRQHLSQPLPQRLVLDGGQPRQPARRRHLAPGHGGQRGLVELDHELRAGHALASSATWAATASAREAVRSATAPGSDRATFMVG